jgi:hypothetical protein
MKLRLPLFLVAAALTTVAPAQEKAKGESKTKTMIFQPGAKAPEGLLAAAEKIETAAPPIANAGDASAPVQLAMQFFASLREGEIDLAYSALTKGSKIGDRPEELRLLKQKTKEAIEVFGVISGHELVENKLVGTRLIRATYVSLGKEFPLRWRFYFYKADNVWRLVDLRVDDKLTGIFDEAEEPKTPEVK